jgi:hypothetical protein
MPFFENDTFRFKIINDRVNFIKNNNSSTIFEYPFLQALGSGPRNQLIDIHHD